MSHRLRSNNGYIELIDAFALRRSGYKPVVHTPGLTLRDGTGGPMLVFLSANVETILAGWASHDVILQDCWYVREHIGLPAYEMATDIVRTTQHRLSRLKIDWEMAPLFEGLITEKWLAEQTLLRSTKGI